MKKQFLLLIIIIFTGVCFSSLKNNSLKACGTNAAAGSGINKTSGCNMQSDYIEYVEYEDASVHKFMNPFIQQ